MGKQVTPKDDYEQTRRDLKRSHNMPGWVIGLAIHPIPQFVRDFVFQRFMYRETICESLVKCYALALWRRVNAKTLPAERAIAFCEKWWKSDSPKLKRR